MADDKTEDTGTAPKPPNRWAYLLLLVITIGLGAPAYEEVREALEPTLGNWAAFALAVLAALVVAFPVYFAANWIVERERNGKTHDLPAMVYRPAILPIWGFCAAALKNIRDLTEYAAWVYVGWSVILLTGAVVLQQRRGRAWSWWVALPVGFVIALIALPAAFFVVWVIAPDQVRPR